MSYKVQHQNEQWAPSPLVAYAMQYHERCEMFDETVCTETRGSLAYPATREQRRASNRNAKCVHADLVCHVMGSMGIDEMEARKRLQRAISETAREFVKTWKSRRSTIKEEPQ